MGIQGDIIKLKRGADYLEVGEFFDDDGNIDISADLFESDIKKSIDDPDTEILASFTITIFQDPEDIDPKTGQPKWKFSRTLSKEDIEDKLWGILGDTEETGGVTDLFRVFPDTIRNDVFDTEIVTLSPRVTPETAP